MEVWCVYFSLTQESSSSEWRLSAKRLGGHLKKDKIIFQSSWLVVPLFLQSGFVWNITENIVQWRRQTIFLIEQNSKNACHFRFTWKKRHKGIYLDFFSKKKKNKTENSSVLAAGQSWLICIICTLWMRPAHSAHAYNIWATCQQNVGNIATI